MLRFWLISACLVFVVMVGWMAPEWMPQRFLPENNIADQSWIGGIQPDVLRSGYRAPDLQTSLMHLPGARSAALGSFALMVSLVAVVALAF